MARAGAGSTDPPPLALPVPPLPPRAAAAVGNIAWTERYHDVLPHIISEVDALDARLLNATLAVRMARRD